MGHERRRYTGERNASGRLSGVQPPRSSWERIVGWPIGSARYISVRLFPWTPIVFADGVEPIYEGKDHDGLVFRSPRLHLVLCISALDDRSFFCDLVEPK